MKVLILDLDHTLIHSVDPKEDIFDKPAFALHLSEKSIYNIYKRPFLEEFLNFCFEKFDRIIIWSAGTLDYVEGILTHCRLPVLEQEKLFRLITRDTYNKHSKDLSHILTHPELKDSWIFFVDDKLDRVKGVTEKCQLVKAEPFYYYDYAGDTYLSFLQSYLDCMLKTLE